MVQMKLQGGVAHIFLERREKANALDSRLLVDLLAALEKTKAHESLRAVVLGGHGSTFCGGADVNEMAELNQESARGFITRIHAVCAAIRALPVPVVARLQGAVIGAGLEIAAACDLRIAAPATKFSMPEVRLGMPSVVEAALLPRLIGSGRTAWLVLTGEAIDAQCAYEWGLVEEVAEDLDTAIDAVLKSLLAGEREALRVQKELLQMWQEAPLSASIAASIERFAQSFAGGNPASRMRMR